jgi:hypothetical protein
MDCETARLFLQFVRPGAHELNGSEADELHAHLEQCSQCNALALAARRLDQHIARAMHAVVVPAGLQERLLERLAGERRAAQRRRLGKISRILAVAACLLLLMWAGYAYFNPARKTIESEIIVSYANLSGRDQDSVNEAFKRLGAPACAPGFVNYSYLTGSPALAELPGYPGKKVPQLTFAYKNHHATVWVLDRARFKVEHPQKNQSGYDWQLAIEPRGDFIYLILFDGSGWTWLVNKDEE